MFLHMLSALSSITGVFGQVFPPSHAARTRHMATALENTPGARKKYCQLRIATPTEQIASAHLRTGRSIRRSRGSPPSCHARTAANRRKTVTKSPNPVKKSQYVRENP